MFNHRLRLFHYFITVVFLSLLSNNINAQQDTRYFLYVSLRGENSIAVYQLNQSDGSLDKVYTQPVTGGPASIALHPSKKYLYVARRNDNAVSAYSTDSSSGKLSFINEIPVVDNPVFIATDNSGKFLLSAYYGASKAAVYPIESSGALNSSAVKIISTGTNPHAILTDNSNRFMYISDMTGNKIEQLSFDSLTGNFTALNPAEILPPPGTGPRHFVFHSVKNIVYFVNETGNSVKAYHIDNTTGLLEEFQTISTLPSGFSAASKCADIHLTPDNRFLYASNRGHESIAAFSVDTSTGELTAINYYPTVNSPREFDIDPSGSYLYAAGETSDNLACYRINKEQGTLDSLYTINVGNTPSWVLAVDYNSIFTSAGNSDYAIFSSENKAYSYPNSTGIGCNVVYFLNELSEVNISVFNISGRLVYSVNQTGIKGYNQFDWNGCDCSGNIVAGGIYLCKIVKSKKTEMVKLLLRHSFN